MRNTSGKSYMDLSRKDRSDFAYLLTTYFFVYSIVYFRLAYSCAYRYDSSAFLFSLANKPGWQPLKLDQTGAAYSYYGYATYSCYSYGPTFGGGHDIYIVSYASTSTSSYTNLGYTYSRPSGYSYGSSNTRSFLAGSYNFQPDEVEVFYETT